VRLLLTSGGVTNAGIRAALDGLLGKPIAGCTVLCIPTAEWGHPMCTPASAAGLAGPAYAIDDQTAIKVTDGTVEVVSEGQWKRLS
jgi:dipeptidase E